MCLYFSNTCAISFANADTGTLADCDAARRYARANPSQRSDPHRYTDAYANDNTNPNANIHARGNTYGDADADARGNTLAPAIWTERM